MIETTNPMTEAIEYLREILAMTREELIREANFADRICGTNIKKNDVILYVFERKFNPEIRDPTVAMLAAKQRNDPFNPLFRKKTS